ncbi:Regulatory-associated protein of TOR 1 [Tetrabaena socialis]|uniref:Regulatory-associated protein of TOR 1 n=1 Tax=Tetrabaena socialis TaxID=47790 RepID=A0A2J8A4V6_9CHLO|nr:Regulatory-associated protein of TOR 1 [Tetrabaena socialis]|eukprot:PNH07533.1 Regulatory-associated protein of TOR 1 [Tetrabaena socialis]
MDEECEVPVPPPPQADSDDQLRPPPRILCEERHDGTADDADLRHARDCLVSKWRQREKLKTTSVALVLCLNIGVDPPDVIKISPCARLECWVDPMSAQPAKALEHIGKNLQAQYERWQPRAKYKMHLDPTVEDVKKLCLSSRRNAKNERVLFHYNGHGVPRPTANGEIWVFNSRYTQYIPLSIYELQSWLGTPCIYVLDCSAAGLIINAIRQLMDQRNNDALRGMQGGVYPGMAAGAGGGGAPDHLKEIIVLGACGANEQLPQNPDLPADVFTACLTTPIKVALRWFCSRSLMRHDGLTKDLIDRIPGKQTDRKTALGELNWIFTAITDTIAWNVLPRPLFQKLFRSDLLVASLFRNFLLAERIMAAAGCTPVSYPRLPPTHQHSLWQAWDLAAEMCLVQLPTLSSDQQAEFTPSTFFAEQLTAFELWLAHGSRDKKPPEQLPIVLQVLLSQVHRLRALVLLGRFLDMGPWAVELALSVGIFPYVLKLLQTTSVDLRSTLVFIWAKVLALDRSCQVDLVKDTGHLYFIRYLDSVDGHIDLYSRAQAAFVLSVICDGHPKGQAMCASGQLLAVLLRWLRSLAPVNITYGPPGHPLLLRWLCLCIGKLCEDVPELSLHAIREGAADILVQLLTSPLPEIRAAAIFGLACLIHSCPDPNDLRGGIHHGGAVPGGGPGSGAALPDHPALSLTPSEDRLPAERLIAGAVTQVVYDPAVLVRAELAVLFARFVRGHGAAVREAMAAQQRRLEDAGAQAPLITRMLIPGAGSEAGGAVPAQQQQQQVLYSKIAEAITMLALDPAPKVARLGRDVLRIAQYELSFAAAAGGGYGGANGSLSPRRNETAVGSFAAKLKPKSWRSSFTIAGLPNLPRHAGDPQDPHHAGSASSSYNASTSVPGAAATVGASSGPAAAMMRRMPTAGVGVGGGVAAASAATSTSASPPSPGRDVPLAYSRHPYTLRTVAEPHFGSTSVGGISDYDQTHHGGHHAYGDTRAHGGAGLAGAMLGGGSQEPGQPPVPVPKSLIYVLSCEYFSRPMLEPQSSAWRESDGAKLCPWTAPVDLERKGRRRAMMDASAAVSRNIRTPKLREQLHSVETGSEQVSALAFHPYHQVLVSADVRGMLKAHTYPDAKLLNNFHVTNGAPQAESRTSLPSRVAFLRHINEADGPLLMAGSADGAAVSIHLVPTLSFPTVYNWSPTACQLFASGGKQPDYVYVWDLLREHCHSVLPLNGAASGSVAMPGGVVPPGVAWPAAGGASSSAGSTGVEQLLLSSLDPNMLVPVCTDGTLRVFDLRAPAAPRMVLQPLGRSALAGAVLEPGCRQGMIVVASEKGEMRWIDLRGGTGAASVGGTASASADESSTVASSGAVDVAHTYKTVQAHTKGGVCALAGHSLAPLLATGTISQVVKLWTDDGDVVGTLRPGNSSNLLAPHKVGPVTAMAFHPYQPVLAAAAMDHCTVYEMYDPGAADRGAVGLRAERSGSVL